MFAFDYIFLQFKDALKIKHYELYLFYTVDLEKKIYCIKENYLLEKLSLICRNDSFELK